MIAKSVLERTATLLGINVDFTQTGETQAALLNCLGQVVEEVSREYADLRKKEKVLSSNGSIPYSSLSQKVGKVIWIKKGGRKARFISYSTALGVEKDGEYEVFYTYILPTPQMTGTVDLPPVYTEEVLSLGVACEYLHRLGYDEDAAYYGNKYFHTLKNLTSCRKDIVLPARSFL